MKKKFSLVIPVAPYRNAEILKSLRRLDYPKSKFEVIVIEGKNPSENRNKGAEKAKGKIIGFLDDDAQVETNLLNSAEKFFDTYKKIDAVGGPQLTPADDKGFAKISGYALCSKFGAAGITERYKRGKLNLNADECLITSANFFIKKDVIKKVKFDTRLFPGEDPKFIADAKREGFRIAYSPDLIIYHRRRSTTKDLAKQVFNYGKVRPLKEKFTDTLKRPLFLVPSLFVIYLWVLLELVMINLSITGGVVITGFNTLTDTSYYLSFLPLTIYILFGLFFSIYESLKNKDYKAFFILPFIYLIIHLSYGAGMIFGFIQKIILLKNVKKNSPY